MRAFITGIAGFAGSHLADLLLSEGIEVWGTVHSPERASNIEHCRDRLNLSVCDIADKAALSGALSEAKPDWVFHLAALSFLPTADKKPQEAVSSNILGSLNLLDCVRQCCPEATVVMISSSAVYGRVPPGELPIKEDARLKPESMYAITKVTQEHITELYHRRFNLRTINLRPFNHLGPRQSDLFVASSFARQIAEIEKGKREGVIHVGDLSAERDFTDVRDVVRAYRLAAEKCEVGETYNICSGKTISIRRVLDTLLELAKIEVRVETEPSRLRSSDLSVLSGDFSKFQAATGWRPEIPIERSLADLLDYWRERV